MENDREGFIERFQGLFMKLMQSCMFRLLHIAYNWYSLIHTRGVSRETL